MTTSLLNFQIIDYLIVILSFSAMMLIGVYYGLKYRKKDFKVSEYLTGDKNFSIFPLAMSCAASTVSGAAYVGVPAEIYVYGCMFVWLAVACPISMTIIAFCFMPIFYDLNVSSIYEYLGKRFDSSVQIFASTIFIVKMTLFTSLYIYSGALVISQITGMGMFMLSSIFSSICVFYTAVGGMKSVVWTDTLQMTVMLICAVFIATVGTQDVGGLAKIFDRARNSGRANFFIFDFDPTIRHSIWTVLIGGIFMNFNVGVDQSVLQRCLSLPTKRKAKIMLMIFPIFSTMLVVLNSYMGFVVYAAYYDCDPLSTGSVEKSDQVVLYFLSDMKMKVPTLPGLFSAAVLSGAFSSVSTALNSLAAVILRDLFHPVYLRIHKKTFPDHKYASIVMKTTVVLIGVGCIFLSNYIESFPNIVTAYMIFSSVTGTVLFGIFALGMLCPRANSIGALYGGILSSAILSWIAIGAQNAVAAGKIKLPKMPVSTDGCLHDFSNVTRHVSLMDDKNITVGAIEQNHDDGVFFLFRISYFYLFVIGPLLVIVIGSILSYFFGSQNAGNVDSNLLCPFIRRFALTNPKNDVELDNKLNRHPLLSSAQ